MESLLFVEIVSEGLDSIPDVWLVPLLLFVLTVASTLSAARDHWPDFSKRASKSALRFSSLATRSFSYEAKEV